MSRWKEKLKRLAQEDREWEEKTPREKPRHYSRKGGHKARSIANDPRKKSRRR